MDSIEIQALRSEIARLESANDLLTTRLSQVDEALVTLGFPQGLDSLVQSLQALFEGSFGDTSLGYGQADGDNPPLAY